MGLYPARETTAMPSQHPLRLMMLTPLLTDKSAETLLPPLLGGLSLTARALMGILGFVS